jgi:macrolide transport system ATP-binding/permease protein
LLRDLGYAFRMLRKTPGFTLVAILSLALGTGANSAMFSFVDGLLFRPLPVAHPGEVLTITTTGKTNGDPLTGISYREYLDFREHCKTMQDFVAVGYQRVGFSATPEAVPKVKYALLVSGSLFQAMGVVPVLGRAFRADEDQVPGRDAVVVLGYDFWREEFGGDRTVLGRTVRITGTDFTVVGVAPQPFTGLDPYLKSAMFLPAMMVTRLSPNTVYPIDMLELRDYRAFSMKARLKPGVTMSQAEAELVNIAQGLAQAYPKTNKDRSVTLRTEMQQRREKNPSAVNFMLLLMAMAASVLLVSCFNVANLLLSRARSRTREVAVRLAMGAGRLRLIRQLLTESLLLGAGGGLVGLWFAWIGVAYLRGFKVPSDLPFLLEFHLNERALIFSMTVALASVLLFGLAPALQGSQVNLVSALKAGSGGESGRRRLWGRNLLVVGQVSISLVLLIVATLLYRSLRSQLLAGTGFRTSGLMMIGFDPKLARYNEDQIDVFYRRLLERTALAPGVKSVATADILPLSILQQVFNAHVKPEGYQFPKGEEGIRVLRAAVSEQFFETMDVPILAGRSFRATDKEGAPKVVVVNEAFVRTYWPGQSVQQAIGKRMRLDDPQESWAEVVGIARTGKYAFITEPPTAFVYFPAAQYHHRNRTLVAASYGDSASVAEPLRQAVRGIDPNMPLLEVRTVEDFFEGGAVSQYRMILNMMGTMGLMALVLAMTGLYGLVSYSVSCRTREFGIRMAIGADRGSVSRMVLRQGVVLAAVGIAVGVAASLPVSGVLRAVIYSAGSEWTPYVLVPALLLAVTLLASYGPARRASRVDPMTALREE